MVWRVCCVDRKRVRLIGVALRSDGEGEFSEIDPPSGNLDKHFINEPIDSREHAGRDVLHQPAAK